LGDICSNYFNLKVREERRKMEMKIGREKKGMGKEHGK
jgi:hypothetical protein